MKKILTLLIAAGAFASVHAQSREQTRDVILGYPNGGYGNHGQYPSYPDNRNYGYDRQYQIDQVNREIDSRINAVQYDRYMSHKDKKREIKALGNERRHRIDEINRYYSNGNHKGWYNGKGNPHHDDDDRYDDRRH
jgi:hypothetical protein